ncbi:MAG: hypothetical protein Q4F95_11655 [Oscillospiraceae bacterium]|nr:hypothetical protein [Oscillospiraceae bacterium]
MRKKVLGMLCVISVLLFSGCGKTSEVQKISGADSFTVEPGKYAVDDSVNSPYIQINDNNTLQFFNYDENEIYAYFKSGFPDEPVPDNACERLKEPYEYTTAVTDDYLISFQIFENYGLSKCIHYNKDDKSLVFLSKEYHYSE